MCRAPEIVEHGHYVDPVDGAEIVVYRCVNCDRGAHQCPICVEVRCDHDLHMSMIGHIPLACRVCRPNGIHQTMTIGSRGVYSPGTRIDVDDDDDVKGFELR